MIRFVAPIFAVVIVSGVLNARIGVSSATNVVFPEPLSVSSTDVTSVVLPLEASAAEPDVTLPVYGYSDRRTVKGFGTFVDDDRFFGFHLGEDVEFGDTEGKVSIRSIAPGKVIFAGWAKGYGGVILVEHEIGKEKINAIYGHLDSTLMLVKAGETVEEGQVMGQLGEAHSHETDGRRKHLHFALYPTSEELHFEGYDAAVENLAHWIDPQVFFTEHGVQISQVDIARVVSETEPE